MFQLGTFLLPHRRLILLLKSIFFYAFQGHLLELLGRLGAGVNKKFFAEGKFVHVSMTNSLNEVASRSLNYWDIWEKAAAKHLFRQKYNGSRGRGRFYADRQKYNIYLRKEYNL